MVALLLTVPWAVEFGLLTVVLAKTFEGQSIRAIAQR
tara:strand:- start:1320 stop:1430 length:111 start_codon:yes stop_codon:yes gene_type:complete